MPVKLNGRIFNTGDYVTFNSHAKNIIPGVCQGMTVEIHRIKGTSPITVGLYSPDSRIDGWGDLNGNVGDYRGWWINAPELADCIEVDERLYEVGKDIDHRGVKLKGMACRILSNIRDGTDTVFVEFDKDVNGCSADGLGKAGHCVALSRKALTVAKKKKKEKHSK